MITKDIARLIHNAYVEIEQGELMIIQLKESINEKGEFNIQDRWGDKRGLELHIPTSDSGAKIRRVPIELALNIIEKHIEAQHRELERLKEVCKIQLK
jgi:hypothetical protein